MQPRCAIRGLTIDRHRLKLDRPRERCGATRPLWVDSHRQASGSDIRVPLRLSALGAENPVRPPEISAALPQHCLQTFALQDRPEEDIVLRVVRGPRS